ncbi:MAG TPA: hypothetical protein VKU01_16235 [Bryobacteraceae bacterium]|nr:hypothetical protein [Bryobacteraceae bacterium]
MEEQRDSSSELRSMIRGVIEEFVQAEHAKAEPAYKTELLEERRRREQLDQRLNELVAENKRTRQLAEEAERHANIRTELQRLGVAKVDLAFRVVRDDIQRAEDGRLVGKSASGEVPLREYLEQFVTENPELLPARIAGGSGSGPVQKSAPAASGFDLEKIRPGMDPEQLERARQEIARIASQTMRGL